MQRLDSSKSGNDIYGPKWHNIESSSESERDDELHPPPLDSAGTDQVSVIVVESPTITSHAENTENQIPRGNGNAESMYNAALNGNWTAAEELLRQDPNLAFDHITEERDRALHVAAARKHEEFVQKLVERMRSPRDLELLDGRGYTACCYVAISGAVEIARVMIEKNPNLATAHDGNNETPLHKAALRGNKKMMSYFLKHCSKAEDLSREEWFDLLLVTIRNGMYDAAIKILLKNGSIATMANEEGTALHLLARCASGDFVYSARDDKNNASDFDKLRGELKTGKSHQLNIMKMIHLMDKLENYSSDDEDDVVSFLEKDDPDFDKLAGELWAEMQKMGKPQLLELIKMPHNILHDAAKEGHVGIVTMLIRTYPQLIRDTDSNGYTIFHTAVKYRHVDIFSLINQVYPMIDLRTLISQDKSGDNILHLAAKLAPLNEMKLPPITLMQVELRWFKAVETILPPSCGMMRNNDELRPRDLFLAEHKTLLKNSEIWIRNMADSCMLIATILLSVMFAAAFTVPGGYDPQTGEPILAKRHWFKVFVVFEVLGVISSVFSIVMFRSIMASSFAKEDFVFKLAQDQILGFYALLWSLACAFSAFMSSISLFNLKMNGLVWFGFCTLYFSGSLWLLAEAFGILKHRKMKKSTRHTISTPLNSTT